MLIIALITLLVPMVTLAINQLPWLTKPTNPDPTNPLNLQHPATATLKAITPFLHLLLALASLSRRKFRPCTALAANFFSRLTVAASNYQSAASERRAFPSGLHSLLDDITSCDTPLLDYSLLFCACDGFF
jgi:hypothetical protein